MNLMMALDDTQGPLSEITSIVHDIRNPLSAIHGGAELLIASTLTEQQVHRVARNMYGASMRIKDLLDEVLSRYRGEGQQIECSDIRQLVSRAVDRISLLAEAQSVQIVQRVPPDVMILVEPRRIERALVNLFVNALEAMPDGGLISILTSVEPQSVLIKIRDTGPGIAPQLRDRIFEPFVTAGKPGGLGLGLALSRQAVVDHGGQMWVEFGGRGACFAMRLPIIPKQDLSSC